MFWEKDPQLSGHRWHIRQFMRENEVDYSDTELDDITRKFLWKRSFSIDEESYNPLNKRKYGVPKCDSDCNLYTDGSKQSDGSAGAGLSVWKVFRHNGAYTTESPYMDYSYHLGNSSIFQAEMYAINKAALKLVENAQIAGIKSAVINTDSLTSLLTLKNKEVKLKLVEETIHNLNAAGEIINLTLRWNKAHDENHRGNHRADTLANEGAKERTERNQPVHKVQDIPRITFNMVKTKLNGIIKDIWHYRFQNNIGYKWPHLQTKDWFPKTCAKFSFQLLNSSRIMFSKKVQIITGHGFFNGHSYKCNPDDDGPGPLCDRCDARVKQTVKHLFTECDAFAHLRLMIFGRAFPSDLLEITDAQLSRFINEINYKWFPFEDPDAITDL